jgi:hypothetical protein
MQAPPSFSVFADDVEMQRDAFSAIEFSLVVVSSQFLQFSKHAIIMHKAGGL